MVDHGLKFVCQPKESLRCIPKTVKGKCHTWRLCGTSGAGKENLPRATTAWNSQSGKKIILHIKIKTYGN